MDLKRCCKCMQKKPIDQFRPKRGQEYKRLRAITGKPYRRTTCLGCENKRVGKKRQLARASGENRAIWILRDARGADKRHRRHFELTKEFIEHLLTQECTYCDGPAQTLDRIDNMYGHFPENVQPSCTRCNYIRGDMPYDAWMCLWSGVKEARDKGYFGTWDGPGRHVRVAKPEAAN